MTAVKSIKTLTIDLPPSCIRFCPAEPEYFVIGTYYLHPSESGQSDDGTTTSTPTIPQKRSGSLIVYRLEGDDIFHITTVATSAHSILDIQWSPHSQLGSLLAIATSTGTLDFYRFTLPSASSVASLALTASHQITTEEILVLSLSWHPSHAHIIGITLSDGTVAFCTSTDITNPWTSNDQPTTAPLQQHSLEAWCLSFLPTPNHLPSVILSGGDDALLVRTSLATGPSASDWQDRKTHFAGVTAILPLLSPGTTTVPDLIVTGSYDDHIRLLHAPASGRRRVLAELNLGGGVWRLQWLRKGKNVASDRGSNNSRTILASCMHAGTRIVRLSCASSSSSLPSEQGEWSFETLFRFEEHESMNYGSDVLATAPDLKREEDVDDDGIEETTTTVVSTSFYDRRVCLWRVEL